MEEEVIIIDADGGQRNAVIVRGGGRPPIVTNNNAGGRGPFGWRPPAYYPQAYPAPVPQVYQPASAPASASTVKTGAKTWIPDIVDILAAVSPLPAPPTATGDMAKDFANAMQYAGGLAASLKRADLLHTAARILEKRL